MSTKKTHQFAGAIKAAYILSNGAVDELIYFCAIDCARTPKIY